MELVYLACPYTHPEPHIQAKRFHIASRAALWFMQKGWIVFSPLSHTIPIEEQSDGPLGWEAFWQKQDFAMLKRCDRLFVLKIEGWKESVGVRDEIKWAEQLSMPISYIDPEDIVL